MRRIALINQKGGVGKTTTTVNLGAALASLGKRVLLMDLDPQGNMSVHVDRAAGEQTLTIYDVLTGHSPISDVIQSTDVPNLWVVPSNIDLSGAELELAASFGRESLLRDAIEQWIQDTNGVPAVDYVLFDCPPSLGLLSVNGMVAACEVIMTLQTEFFALQGMSKLVEVIGLLRRRMNPDLEIAGILPCLYDTRLKLAREVLAEIRNYFPGQVFERPIAKNVKLAEAPSYGQTIFQYAPNSSGAKDYQELAEAVIAQEAALNLELDEPSAGPFGDSSAGPFALPAPDLPPVGLPQTPEPAAVAETAGTGRTPRLAPEPEGPGADDFGSPRTVPLEQLPVEPPPAVDLEAVELAPAPRPAATQPTMPPATPNPVPKKPTPKPVPAPRPAMLAPIRPNRPPVLPSVQQPSDLPE